MKLSASLLFIVGSLAALPALASPELAASKGCMACHSLDKKVLGPALKDVAAKYKSQPDATAYLVERVQKGSVANKLVWGGPAGMPPLAGQVSEADTKVLVAWILGLK